MPIFAAILGAVVTGLLYWLIWGKGLEYIDHAWRESSNRRQDAKRRAAAMENRQLAAVRSITDARDAASTLMVLVAQQRGVLTPEQLCAIQREMTDVLKLAPRELPQSLTFARFAADQVATETDACDVLAVLLRSKLNNSEKEELTGMLTRVASVHGGPTDQQEQLISYNARRLKAQS
jgi:hypothetical protein